jgi:4-hydroxy-2-oxoheptanedioate aldolase
LRDFEYTTSFILSIQIKETLMSEATLSGVEFKKQLRAGQPKLGLFLNAHSPTVAEQLAFSGYDWLLVDTQHGPMGYEKLSAMLSGISNGGAKSMVRVGGYSDRPGIQQALDLGADGQVSDGRHSLRLLPPAQHE